MKLYLVRHGSTGANEGGRRQSPQTPLSEEGKLQAQKAARWLADKKIEVILSSPWMRAKQTAEIIASKLGKQISFLDILHEKAHHPDLYGASFDDEIHKEYVIEFSKNKNDIDWKLRGKGESTREMLERGMILGEMVLEKYEDKVLVVVSHAYFIKGFLTICLGGKNFETKKFKERFKTISVDNDGVSLLEREGKGLGWQAPFLNLKV